MKKVILLIVMILLVGCNNNSKVEEVVSSVESVIEEDIVYLDTSQLKEKLAYDENNITVEYVREIKSDNTYYYVQIPIRTDDMFTYYEDKNPNISKEEFDLIIPQMIDWLKPQYQDLYEDLVNKEYKQIDYILGSAGTQYIIYNLDKRYTVFVYDDNRLKINDDGEVLCYQATEDFTSAYEMFDHMDAKLMSMREKWLETEG